MQEQPKLHSKMYAPSKSNIWMNCPLSALLNDGSVDEISEVAEFGTQTHELGAAQICQSLKVSQFNDKSRTVDELKKTLSLYSKDMQDIADKYTDYIIGTVDFETNRTKTKPLIFIESHLDMDFDEDAGGTLDFGMISEYGNGTLTVVDLKTGRVKINAYDEDSKSINTQLGMYALGLYKIYKEIYSINLVRLIVFQPVIGNTSVYEMPIEELICFEKERLIPSIVKTKLPYPEATSDKHCKYCGARALCRTRAEANQNALLDINKKVNELTEDEIENFLPKIENIIAYCQDVKDYCINRAKQGHRFKNFKLVYSKVTRKIKDENAVIKLLKDNGYDPYVDRKLAGITELTSRLGKEKFDKLLGDYIVKQEGSIMLVPTSDEREEITIEKKEK